MVTQYKLKMLILHTQVMVGEHLGLQGWNSDLFEVTFAPGEKTTYKVTTRCLQ